MSFQFWQDEEMTTSATELSFVFDNNSTTSQGVVYFGSPDTNVALQTISNQGVANVELTPTQSLQQPERGVNISVGQCFIVNDIVFQCVTAGDTSSTAVSYPNTVGQAVQDGGAVMNGIYPAHKPSEIKLALSENGIEQATAGGSIGLGNTVRGGAAIAVYYKIENGVRQVSDTGAYNNLCIAINDCVEVAI